MNRMVAQVRSRLIEQLVCEEGLYFGSIEHVSEEVEKCREMCNLI
jgi:hypothetical protein